MSTPRTEQAPDPLAVAIENAPPGDFARATPAVAAPSSDLRGRLGLLARALGDGNGARDVREAAAALRELEKERDAAKEALQKECDRDWKDETFWQTVMIAANGLYWRGKRIQEAERRAEELEKQLENERMKVAGCSTAAVGAWKEGNAIAADYECAAIHDVARLYHRVEALKGLLSEALDKWEELGKELAMEHDKLWVPEINGKRIAAIRESGL